MLNREAWVIGALRNSTTTWSILSPMSCPMKANELSWSIIINGVEDQSSSFHLSTRFFSHSSDLYQSRSQRIGFPGNQTSFPMLGKFLTLWWLLFAMLRSLVRSIAFINVDRVSPMMPLWRRWRQLISWCLTANPILHKTSHGYLSVFMPHA